MQVFATLGMHTNYRCIVGVYSLPVFNTCLRVDNMQVFATLGMHTIFYKYVSLRLFDLYTKLPHSSRKNHLNISIKHAE